MEYPCTTCNGHVFDVGWEDVDTYVTCPRCHTRWHVSSDAYGGEAWVIIEAAVRENTPGRYEAF